GVRRVRDPAPRRVLREARRLHDPRLRVRPPDAHPASGAGPWSLARPGVESRRARPRARRGGVLELEGPHGARSPRIAGLLLATTVVLVVATAALTFQLVHDAVEERVRQEIARTAALVGGRDFPLSDESLRRLAGFIGAEVVASDDAGRVVASSLGPEQRRVF